MLEIYSGSALYDEIAAPVAVQQLRPGRAGSRRMRKRRRPPRRRAGSTTTTASRVTGCSASARQRSVAAPRLWRAIASRTGSMSLPSAPDARAAQRGQFGADRTGRVVHRSAPAAPAARPGAAATGAAVACCSASSVNSQFDTSPKLAQLFRGTAAQQRRLHQHRRPVTEPGAHRGDVGDPGGVGQLEFGDRGQRRGTRFRPQVADVVGAEAQPGAQEGLTPVTITL